MHQTMHQVLQGRRAAITIYVYGLQEVLQLSEEQEKNAPREEFAIDISVRNVIYEPCRHSFLRVVKYIACAVQFVASCT